MASDVLRFKCLDALNKYIASHEDTHTVKYIVRSTDKSFTDTLDKAKIAKKQKRFIDGIASTVIGCKVMHCRHGPDNHVTDKLKHRVRAMEAKNSDFPSLKKSRRLDQDTWKFNCPATVKIQRLICYPEYKLPHEDTNKHVKSRIMSRLSQDESPCEEDIFLLRISAIEAHKNHPTGEHGGYQPMDKRIKERIKFTVSHLYVTKTREVKEQLDEFVKSTFIEDPPPISNRRFYPTMRDIKNVIDSALRAATAACTHPHHQSLIKAPTSSTSEAPTRDTNMASLSIKGISQSKVKAVPPLSTSLSAIRSLCDKITNWTYDCTNEAVASEVLKRLSVVHKQCSGVKSHQEKSESRKRKSSSKVLVTKKAKISSSEQSITNLSSQDLGSSFPTFV